MKILIHLLPGIGNTLLFTPTLREIRKKFPKAEITVLVMYKASMDILKNNPNVDKLILWEFQKKGHLKSFLFVLKLRLNNYDVSIMPYPANNYYYTGVSFLCGGKKRISHKYPIKKYRAFSFLFTNRIKLDANAHEIHENLKLLSLLDVDYNKVDDKLDIYLSEENMSNARKFLKSNKISATDIVVGIHPGSSVQAGMINKRWNKNNFIEAANLLAKDIKCKFLLFGGDDENDIKEYIKNRVANSYLANKSNILDTAAIISRCNAFLTNDTGLMHIAAAVGTRVVVLEGPNDPIRTAPVGGNNLAIYLPLFCRPCYEVGNKIECRFGHYNCLKFIDVVKVVNALKSILKN